jgi:hypothetical protein
LGSGIPKKECDNKELPDFNIDALPKVMGVSLVHSFQQNNKELPDFNIDALPMVSTRSVRAMSLCLVQSILGQSQ